MYDYYVQNHVPETHVDLSVLDRWEFARQLKSDPCEALRKTRVYGRSSTAFGTLYTDLFEDDDRVSDRDPEFTFEPGITPDYAEMVDLFHQHDLLMAELGRTDDEINDLKERIAQVSMLDQYALADDPNRYTWPQDPEPRSWYLDYDGTNRPRPRQLGLDLSDLMPRRLRIPLSIMPLYDYDDMFDDMPYDFVRYEDLGETAVPNHLIHLEGVDNGYGEEFSDGMYVSPMISDDGSDVDTPEILKVSHLAAIKPSYLYHQRKYDHWPTDSRTRKVQKLRWSANHGPRKFQHLQLLPDPPTREEIWDELSALLDAAEEPSQPEFYDPEFDQDFRNPLFDPNHRRRHESDGYRFN